MEITQLQLKNYRNHLDFSSRFDPNTTVITGENGSGKTNILESIHLLSVCKSPRTKYDTDLINHQKNFASIIGKVNTSDNDDNTLEILVQRKQDSKNKSIKKVKVNKVNRAIYKFTGMFTSVLFAPEDIQLLTRNPSVRRKYIDSLLFQTDRKYKKDLSEYQKAVRQRNKLLEDFSFNYEEKQQLDYWTNIALERGLYIQNKRSELFDSLQANITSNISLLDIARESIIIRYKKNEISEKRFDEYKDKEHYARTTLIGPHRDDFEVYIDGYDTSTFGSRGQQRGIILALKLAEINYIEAIKGERPVLLLDDIFSELDDNHRKAVLKILPKQQNIITSAEKHLFLNKFPKIDL